VYLFSCSSLGQFCLSCQDTSSPIQCKHQTQISSGGWIQQQGSTSHESMEEVSISQNTMRSSLTLFLWGENQWKKQGLRRPRNSKALLGIEKKSLSCFWGIYTPFKYHTSSHVSAQQIPHTLSQDSFQENIMWHNWVVKETRNLHIVLEFLYALICK